MIRIHLILYHRKPRSTRSVKLSITVVLLVGLNACATDRALPPTVVKHNLFVTVASPSGKAIQVFDAEADTLVYHIPDAGSDNAFTLSASAGGTYLATLAQNVQVNLFDARTYTLLGSLPTNGWEFAFSSGPTRIVASNWDSTFVYDVPGLARIGSLPYGFAYVVSCPDSATIIGIERWEPYPHRPIPNRLVRLAIPSGEILDSFTFESPINGGPVLVEMRPVLSPEGRYVYFVGADNEGFALFSFEIETGACRFRTQLVTDHGAIQVSPDGREIWLTQSFAAGHYPPPPQLGYVLMLAASSGEPIDTVRTYGLNKLFPEWPLRVMDIEFHPSEPKAYVAARSGRPGILIINTNTRTVDSTIYADSLVDVYDMLISMRY